MSRDILLKILDLARWAPSGDNTQPWRFQILGELHLRIHGFDTRDHILYDFQGHASHIAHGALLETLRIAASQYGLSATWNVCSEVDDRTPKYDVILESSSLPVDPLARFIETRMVQRRPMSCSPLNEAQRKGMREAAGCDFRVDFFESRRERLSVAHLLWDNAYLRLTCPEAYPVHREIIEWGAQFSKDRIPEQAVGVDPATAKLMRWVMQKWERVAFFNRFLMGTVLPRIQLDVLPAFYCAAHLLIRPNKQPESLNDWIALGGSMQRVWLTAAQQGLHLQPEMTPVIFRWYARSQTRFSSTESLHTKALNLSGNFEQLAGATESDPFGFFGRVGVSPTPLSRSTRQDLDFLMLD